VTEREAFEAWLKAKNEADWAACDHSYPGEPKPVGWSHIQSVHSAWEAWKGRAALSLNQTPKDQP
jgi:hypothetical protein